jgi:putative pyruvate formate lyase activating enzyme
MERKQSSGRDQQAFLVTDFQPCYASLLQEGGLEAKVARARQELAACRACPRECGVNRFSGEPGVCRTGQEAFVASAFPHHGEEACLVGRRGSGTIFFSYCNLHCVFCQNWDLSQRRDGVACDPGRIAELMLQLQDWGCHNINFVTPEHVVPQVIEAIATAVVRGLRLPIVYNTSAYDCLSSLSLLDGLIDIYMPDFKFWQPETARRLSKARDYPKRARAAIAQMHRQVGPLKFDGDGVALRGVLVRHLVLPGRLEETAAIMKWLAEEISPDTFVNIMGQYRPCYRVGQRLPDGTVRYDDINRRPSITEMKEAFAGARQAGLWRLEGQL